MNIHLPCSLMFLITSLNVFSADWWDAGWKYRIPVTVDAGLYDRTDALAVMDWDEKKIADQAKLTEAIDPASIRLIETDAVGKKTKETPYALVGNRLVWKLDGKMENMSQRTFNVYFDTVSTKKNAVSYPPIEGMGKILGENLIKNGSFEEATDGKPAGWSSGSHRVSDEAAHAGKNSMKITSDDPQDGGTKTLVQYATDIPVKPTTKYEIRGWIKSAASGEQVIAVYCLDQNKNNLIKYETKRYVMFSGLGIHDWMGIKRIYETVPETAYLQVRMLLFKSTGTAYFDDIELAEVSSQDLPVTTVGTIEFKK